MRKEVYLLSLKRLPLTDYETLCQSHSSPYLSFFSPPSDFLTAGGLSQLLRLSFEDKTNPSPTFSSSDSEIKAKYVQVKSNEG